MWNRRKICTTSASGAEQWRWCTLVAFERCATSLPFSCRGVDQIIFFSVPLRSSLHAASKLDQVISSPVSSWAEFHAVAVVEHLLQACYKDCQASLPLYMDRLVCVRLVSSQKLILFDTQHLWSLAVARHQALRCGCDMRSAGLSWRTAHAGWSIRRSSLFWGLEICKVWGAYKLQEQDAMLMACS